MQTGNPLTEQPAEYPFFTQSDLEPGEVRSLSCPSVTIVGSGNDDAVIDLAISTVLKANPQLAANRAASISVFMTLLNEARAQAPDAHPVKLALRLNVSAYAPAQQDAVKARSEERRVGKECRSRW